MSDRIKYIGLIAAFAVLIAGSLGCFTLLASSSGSSEVTTPLLSDTVFAVGRPDADLTRKIGVPAPIAFLGKKNTYMVLEGGEILLRIATDLDGKRIILKNESRKLFLKDKNVWGSLSLVYRPERNRPYSPDEIAELTKLGFIVGTSGTYEINVPVKGVLYPPLAVSDEQFQRFKVNRQLNFFDPTGPLPDFSKLITVPVALFADFVTLPIQIVGFAVIVLTVGH